MEEPTLICRLPGETVLRRYAFTGISRGRLTYGDAEISPWPGEDVFTTMSVAETSMPRNEYLEAVADVVASLQVRGGKTVICRQICGSFNSFEPERIAEEYFALFPDMFCFLFHHPASGWWMGASPELLLEEKSDNLVYTRALAGTRRSGCQEPWSNKNIEEHTLVVEDICRRVADAGNGINAIAEARYNFRYGRIEHLCTPIRIEKATGKLSVDDIIARIHPTPAVCGFPCDVAMTEIARAERNPRNYYGGVITVRHNGLSTAYVVLRCVHFDSSHWAVYTGSGITAASDPIDEWQETDDKAAPLISILSKYS